MKVLKKINHNTVLVDDQGVEKIAMGKGIGFSAVVNCPLDAAAVDKYFVLDSLEKMKRFSEIVRQIPPEFIEFAEEIIQLISAEINIPLDSNIYIALTDHIYFAIQRADDTQVSAIMLPEMKLLYPKEYRVAGKAVQIINDRYHTKLGINEVGFITMHIINAELKEENSFNSLKILEMTAAVLQFLEAGKIGPLDKESLIYQRLMIHVKFLVTRLIYHETTNIEDPSFVTETFKKSPPFETALAVKQMIFEKYAIPVNENEVTYLAMHLARIK